ncbi:MAG TPA: hypothetical protein VK824_02040, partial [Planctomycetota bacterium]|nr:hypothetical protein [Planctomycetota bacterium]
MTAAEGHPSPGGVDTAPDGAGASRASRPPRVRRLPWLPRPPRSALLLAGALLANEVWCNVSVVVECFWGAKVMRSVSSDVAGLAWQIGTTVAGMLALTALLLLGVASAWTAACRVVAADVARRHGG